MSNRRLFADLTLLFVTMIWGSSFILMKNTISTLHPVAFLTIRFILASSVVTLIFHKNIRSINKSEVIYGSVVGFCLFIGMILQVMGLKYTYASKSAFITGLTVVLVPLFTSVLYKKIPKLNVAVGVFLAFVGLSFLNGANFTSFNFGDLLTLIADLGFAFQIIFIDVFTSKENIDTINLSIIQLISSAIFYIAFLCIFKINLFNTAFTTVSIVTILITGIFGTALAFTAQVFVQKYTTPTHTALIFSAEPVFGAIFSAIIPSVNNTVEILPLISYVGCGLILIGMIVAEINFRWS